ncbi:DUF3108 domain-containing protein [Algoriphagus sp. CAU 1675]|uniref:DUF3108 domain-containing protein n=1 Tax=Algoriphagus sp. CAU 1675 TaxID=3032597 RepID=UPI0023DC7F1C|nr:DUF3108 domain-containing protein [Algoriphagus sp. CAU 1675]MDF2159053.1 DUF3108 domain-containing protein [Algoriphagus sp. CAU 1675]
MNIFKSLILCFLILAGHSLHAQENSNEAFTFGEELNFEVSYGWLNLADAKMQISRRAHQEDNRDHFKIDVFGKTKGAATIFGRVNDNWGTYLDVETKLPKISYRHIEEGRYRKHEKVFFDQKDHKAFMQLFDRENKTLQREMEFALPGQVQDIVSGFYYLRTLDLGKLSPGDTVFIKGFFDKEIYNINLIFEGEEKLDTELGKVETYIFSPQVPENKLFRGEYPVKVWVTKDKNKIPVKIKANLFLGSLNFDIVSAKGLKNN